MGTVQGIHGQVDLFDIRLSFDSYASADPDPSDPMTNWWVTASQLDPERETDEPLRTVGRWHIVMVDCGKTSDPFVWLDGVDADLGRFGEALFDEKGDPHEDLHGEVYDRVMLINRVRLEEDFRGHRLGAILTGRVIEYLSANVGVVALMPWPADIEDDDPNFKKAKRKIEKVWESLNFKPWRYGVWTTSLAWVGFDEALAKLVADYEANAR